MYNIVHDNIQLISIEYMSIEYPFHIQAVAIIPRGQRATDLLNVSCGTQSISPLHLGTKKS